MLEKVNELEDQNNIYKSEIDQIKLKQTNLGCE